MRSTEHENPVRARLTHRRKLSQCLHGLGIVPCQNLSQVPIELVHCNRRAELDALCSLERMDRAAEPAYIGEHRKWNVEQLGWRESDALLERRKRSITGVVVR